jgi:aspartate oxidase
VEDGPVPNEILTSEAFRKTFGNLSKAARESLSLKPDQDLPADVMRDIYARAIAAELEHADQVKSKNIFKKILDVIALLGVSVATEFTTLFKGDLAAEMKQ